MIHALFVLVMTHRVLIVGDSMTHRGPDDGPEQAEVLRTDGTDRSSAPGDLMASHLLEQGFASAARLDARVGRSAYNFWRREDAQGLLKRDATWRPSIAIVMLGTNDIGLNLAVDEKSMRNIRDWLKATGAEVWGIGPPSFADPVRMRGTDGIVLMMRRVFGSRFIDARPLTTDLVRKGRAGDLIHFTGDGSRLFGARLAQAFTDARAWRLLRSIAVAVSTTVAPSVPIAIALARR